MKKIILGIMMFFIYIHVYGQRTCGSELNLTELQQTDPLRYQRFINLENQIQMSLSRLTELRAVQPSTKIIIPVVVHSCKSIYFEDLENGGTLSKTLIYAGDYEKEILAAGNTKEYDYIYTPEGLSAIAIKTNGSRSLYYLHTDHLGSIRTVTTAAKGIQTRYYYDAWGKQTLMAGTSITNRGYLAQEHLPQSGLINLNARLYDPTLGRFLAMDPFVQAPGFSQAFNRYSYAFNNPLKYTDANGEFIFVFLNVVKDFLTNTFVNVWSQGINAWTKSENWHSTVMAWKIDMGMYQGNFGQVVSRLTWESPQSGFGYFTSHFHNTFNGVRSVSYYDGAAAVESYSSNWGAFTLGNYINGERGLNADPNNSLFQHEYGHYLQSQAMGWAYLSRVGIPSLMSASKSDGMHDFQPFEQDANRRAFMYFNEKVEGFYTSHEQYIEQRDNRSYINGTSKGWNFYKNPLDVYHTATSGVYYDYHSQAHRDLINTLSLSAKWFDYYGMTPMGFPMGIIAVGIGNGIYYNNHRVK